MTVALILTGVLITVTLHDKFAQIGVVDALLHTPPGEPETAVEDRQQDDGQNGRDEHIAEEG
jgi:hypothetical protein